MNVTSKELNERLDRLTSPFVGVKFSKWFPYYSQMMISQSDINHTISIDRREVVDKTDAEVRKLILSRISDGLICALNEAEKQLDKLGDE